jgi:hypothetical protein
MRTPVESIDSDIPARIGNAHTGELLALDDAEFGVDQVQVMRNYTAASGRTCRKLANAEGVSLVRVGCQRNDGSWYLSRSLATTNTSRKPLAEEPTNVVPLLVPADESVTNTARESSSDEVSAETAAVVMLDDSGADTVNRQLATGETLWSFAARVTGDPKNWQSIAATNGIEDSREVPQGQVLKVPSALIKGQK